MCNRGLQPSCCRGQWLQLACLRCAWLPHPNNVLQCNNYICQACVHVVTRTGTDTMQCKLKFPQLPLQSFNMGPATCCTAHNQFRKPTVGFPGTTVVELPTSHTVTAPHTMWANAQPEDCSLQEFQEYSAMQAVKRGLVRTTCNPKQQLFEGTHRQLQMQPLRKKHTESTPYTHRGSPPQARQRGQVWSCHPPSCHQQ